MDIVSLITPENITLAVASIVSIVGGTKWALVKKELHNVRVLFDVVDDAATDNTVTEPEFQAALTAARAVVSPNSTNTAPKTT
jgi:hypothetical protein